VKFAASLFTARHNTTVARRNATRQYHDCRIFFLNLSFQLFLSLQSPTAFLSYLTTGTLQDPQDLLA
jgi:hypothetical protein